MPRYFFDLVDSDGLVPDETGTVLKGIEAVRNEATKALREVAADTGAAGAKLKSRSVMKFIGGSSSQSQVRGVHANWR